MLVVFGSLFSAICLLLSVDGGLSFIVYGRHGCAGERKDFRSPWTRYYRFPPVRPMEANFKCRSYSLEPRKKRKKEEGLVLQITIGDFWRLYVLMFYPLYRFGKSMRYFNHFKYFADFADTFGLVSSFIDLLVRDPLRVSIHDVILRCWFIYPLPKINPLTSIYPLCKLAFHLYNNIHGNSSMEGRLQNGNQNIRSW